MTKVSGDMGYRSSVLPLCANRRRSVAERAIRRKFAMATIEPPYCVFDPHVPLKQAPELERSEVDVPDAVVDLLEPDVFADADGGDVDPSLFQRMPPLALT